MIYPHENLLLTDDEQTSVHIGFGSMHQEQDEENLDSRNSIDFIFFTDAKVVGD